MKEEYVCEHYGCGCSRIWTSCVTDVTVTPAFVSHAKYSLKGDMVRRGRKDELGSPGVDETPGLQPLGPQSAFRHVRATLSAR